MFGCRLWVIKIYRHSYANLREKMNKVTKTVYKETSHKKKMKNDVKKFVNKTGTAQPGTKASGTYLVCGEMCRNVCQRLIVFSATNIRNCFMKYAPICRLRWFWHLHITILWPVFLNYVFAYSWISGFPRVRILNVSVFIILWSQYWSQIMLLLIFKPDKFISVIIEWVFFS